MFNFFSIVFAWTVIWGTSPSVASGDGDNIIWGT